MPKVTVYNMEGKEIGQQELNPKIFAVKGNASLVHQAVIAQMANKRKVLAHTKTRGEVRGGGIKPWNQKGTGRARHGSIRSPLWVGGGVVFGPRKNRNFSQKINKKMKRKAILMCLSDKTVNQKLVLLDRLEMPEIKTKKMLEILSRLPSKGRKTLIILPTVDNKIIKSANNIVNIKTIKADSLNVVDVLNYDYLLVPEESIKVMEKVYLTNAKKPLSV